MPPFYVYRCPKCGREQTEMRPMADRNHRRPKCDNGDIEIEMELTLTPVPGFVQNPAVPKREKR